MVSVTPFFNFLFFMQLSHWEYITAFRDRSKSESKRIVELMISLYCCAAEISIIIWLSYDLDNHMTAFEVRRYM